MRRLIRWLTDPPHNNNLPSTRTVVGGDPPAADPMPPVFTGSPAEYPAPVRAALARRAMDPSLPVGRHDKG